MPSEKVNRAQRVPLIKQKRSFAQYVLLSLVTFSLYHYFFLDSWVKDINLLCKKDGRHTVGVAKMLLFSVLTLGIYKYLWIAEIVDRLYNNAEEYDVDVRQDGEVFFLWVILVPFLGYFIAMYQAIRDTNRLAEAYGQKQQECAEVRRSPVIQRPPRQKRGALRGLTGDLAGMSIEMAPGQAVTLGRNPAESSVIVEGEKISRTHCSVQYNGKQLGYSVTDHSRNGVFINGNRIPYNVPMYASEGSIIALADGANKFQLM